MGMFIFGMGIALFVIVAMEELKEKIDKPSKQPQRDKIPCNLCPGV
jgi:hypothetical protein